MAVLNFLRNTYSRNVYLYGSTKLENVLPGYEEPVKEYAANLYDRADLKNALDKGFVTQEQYDQTMAYRTVDKGTDE